MTVKPIKYARKAFYVDAVEVTAENLEDVASWCQGEVRKIKDDSGTEKYVKVRVHRPLNERQTKAFVGDVVLYAGTGFKVYTPKAFTSSFEAVEKTDDGPGDLLFVGANGADAVQELFVTAEQV